MSQSVSALSHTASSTDNTTSSVSTLNTSRRSYYSSTSESGASVSTTQPDSVPGVQAQSNTFNSASMGGGGDAGSLNSGTATSTAANEQVSRGSQSNVNMVRLGRMQTEFLFVVFQSTALCVCILEHKHITCMVLSK